MFSLQDLMTIVAVADTGSIRAAAAVLGRTQPAVTQAVRRLEDGAGFQLLDRAAYRATLTREGQAFVDRARPALKQLQSLQTFGVLLASGVEPRLRIAIDTATPNDAWTALVGPASSRFPATVMEIEAGEGLAPLRRLGGGEADLALVYDAVIDQTKSAYEATFCTDVTFVTLVRADRRDLLGQADAAFPQIVVADFERPDPAFGLVEGQSYWRVSSHVLQMDAICAGFGWGCVPEAFVPRQLDDPPLVTVAHMGLRERSSHSLFLCRRRDRVLGPVGAAVWETAAARA